MPNTVTKSNARRVAKTTRAKVTLCYTDAVITPSEQTFLLDVAKAQGCREPIALLVLRPIWLYKKLAGARPRCDKVLLAKIKREAEFTAQVDQSTKDLNWSLFGVA